MMIQDVAAIATERSDTAIIVTAIVGFASLIFTTLFSHITQQNDRKAEVKETAVVLDKIHIATNSNTAAADARNIAAEARIKEGQEKLEAANTKLEQAYKDALISIEETAAARLAEVSVAARIARRRPSTPRKR